MMRVLICGSRDYRKFRPIHEYVKTLAKDTIIIHGGAKGADRFAGIAAGIESLEIEIYRPDWNHYGKAAGVIRNQEMLDEGKPDLVVYFSEDIENSRGTKDMVRRAKKAGIEVIGNPLLDGKHEE